MHYEDALSHWSAALELVEEFGGDRDFSPLSIIVLAELMGGGQRVRPVEYLEEACEHTKNLVTSTPLPSSIRRWETTSHSRA